MWGVGNFGGKCIVRFLSRIFSSILIHRYFSLENSHCTVKNILKKREKNAEDSRRRSNVCSFIKSMQAAADFHCCCFCSIILLFRSKFSLTARENKNSECILAHKNTKPTHSNQHELQHQLWAHHRVLFVKLGFTFANRIVLQILNIKSFLYRISVVSFCVQRASYCSTKWLKLFNTKTLPFEFMRTIQCTHFGQILANTGVFYSLSLPSLNSIKYLPLATAYR